MGDPGPPDADDPLRHQPASAAFAQFALWHFATPADARWAVVMGESPGHGSNGRNRSQMTRSGLRSAAVAKLPSAPQNDPKRMHRPSIQEFELSESFLRRSCAAAFCPAKTRRVYDLAVPAACPFSATPALAPGSRVLRRRRVACRSRPGRSFQAQALGRTDRA
jgi:hypothetical protein